MHTYVNARMKIPHLVYLDAFSSLFHTSSLLNTCTHGDLGQTLVIFSVLSLIFGLQPSFHFRSYFSPLTSLLDCFTFYYGILKYVSDLLPTENSLKSEFEDC